MEFKHLPVMLDECIDGLKINPDGIYLDGTLGGGGHSEQIAKRLINGRLIAVDKDSDAIAAASKRLAPYNDKITYIHDDFKNAPAVIDEMGIGNLDGVLLDLGVSSYQLDNAERGFSYMHDAPLDMRMNREQSLDAYTVVNEYSEKKLMEILRDYGEEKLAYRIASNIVQKRAIKPIETTAELSKIVEDSYPAATRWKFGHPSKRTFQAIRIEVNGELSALEDAVRDLTRKLKSGGRIAILTFHSLEDRIVKNVFKELNLACTCPPDFPVCVCGKKQEIEIITKKPVTASEKELAENSRAECAKLRIAEKI
ncbi:MAG: 16S rRNA (cytosine(1402)-N(4))-methyltransferase RsmH [Clostridia bacterium]|nr:16S rRNA (cytosine(1402)-N(4))-methyltransferase RsmH [Clostridia bacterium]